jgi:membrane associated rhomboid family serine protease
VACIVVFVLAEMNGSTMRTNTLLEFGGNWRGKVWHGEWWRLFTSMFLHIGVLHLVLNVWAGFSWSAPLERRLGPLRFTVLYVLSGVAGSAASVMGNNAVSAGASGALFGVIGGSLVLIRLHLGSWKAVVTEPALRTNHILIALWLVVGPYLGFDGFAHVGGMVAGMVLTWGLVSSQRAPLAMALVAVAALVGASLQPIPGLHPKWVDSEALEEAWETDRWGDVVTLTDDPILDEDLKPFRAHALIELGRLSEAEPLIPLAAEVPDDALWVASLHDRVGHPERAIQALETATRQAPGDPSHAANLIFALEATGKPEHQEQAKRLGDLLALQSPTSAEGQGFRARQLIREGKLEAALEPMTQAAKDRPDLFASELAILHLELDRGR